MKRQIPLVAVIAPALLVVAVVGYFLLVKPKQDAAADLDGQIAELQSQVDAALAARQTSRSPEAKPEVKIRVADLFRLSKAMPDREDMPGIMLELNGIASATGVEFVSIAPSAPVPLTGYTAVPINLKFEGSYYDLTDFLFRTRNLVLVRDGQLHAQGRLFTLDKLDLHEGAASFPQIAADLTVTAYVYATAPADGAAPAAPGTPTDPATTPTDTTATPPASDATALGGS